MGLRVTEMQRENNITHYRKEVFLRESENWKMIEHDGISIRCIEDTDLEFVCFCANPAVYGTYQGFRFTSQTAVLGAFREDGLWGDDGGVLVVEEEHEPVGLAQVTFVREGLARVGLILLPDNRGCGIGTQALTLLRDYLCDNYPLARIEADTDTENIAGQRILERAGFVCEGTLRAYRFRGGSYHDSLIYSYITQLGRNHL